ncbi:MAG: DMT family transporter [Geitlerinemataceae cyanobacterium]
MTQPLKLQEKPAIAFSREATVPLEPEGSQPPLKAFVNLIIALIAVSFAAIFIRYSTDDIGANATVFSRFVVFVLTFGTVRAIATLRQKSDTEFPSAEPPISRKQLILLVAVGAIATTSLVLWAMSLTRTSVANSVLLNNLTPLFTSLGGWLFLGQTFDRRFLLGLGIALGGAIALGASDLHLGGETLWGDGYALLSAAFLATYFLLAERLRDRFSATTILLWRCSVGLIILFPLVLLTEGGQFFPTTLSGWGAAIALGIICEGLGQRLLASSFELFSSSFISLFLLLEPPLSALLAWAIFGEQMGAANWVSLGIVSIGLYIAQSSDTATASMGDTPSDRKPEAPRLAESVASR